MSVPFIPLFDTLEHFQKHNDEIQLSNPFFMNDYDYTINFLRSYTGSRGTFNAYRREVERFLHWSWSLEKKSLSQIKRDDIERYILFCQNPPKSWIALKKTPRFIDTNGLRLPNPLWRPFVVTIKKSAIKQGQIPEIEAFNLSQGAISEIFAILSTYFNFLVAEEYLTANPVALIRQKSKFIRKRQSKSPIRRLSLMQWEAVLNAAESLALSKPAEHERTRFILSLLFGMYLRISELSASDRFIPSMNHFAKDAHGHWWFTTVGKGNKERQIAVSDEVLNSLKRWRIHLKLSPLPPPNDSSPLIPKLRGKGPMSDPAPIRRLVQRCFDQASLTLRQEKFFEDADNLAAATVHWLRHTGISEDIKHRPREHVRDDAGHSSSATTDRYIDVELQARYLSAKKKQIVPDD